MERKVSSANGLLLVNSRSPQKCHSKLMNEEIGILYFRTLELWREILFILL